MPTPDVTLVTRLLREQVPDLADLPLHPIHAGGSSNWVLRLGDELAVRLPRSDEYAQDLITETTWTSRFAPHLSVPVPEVRHLGHPGPEFSRPWAVVAWVPGEPVGDLDATRQTTLAEGLGQFVAELHEVPTFGQAAGPQHWGYRQGEPVTAQADAWVKQAADSLADLYDPRAVREAWARVRQVPAASGPARWVHADLSAENLLVTPRGALSGLVDFGALGLGDGSVDLLYAWSLFDEPARHALCVAAGADEATWLRARAWAFGGPGLLTLAEYRGTMPARTARLRRQVETVAAEVGVALR